LTKEDLPDKIEKNFVEKRYMISNTGRIWDAWAGREVPQQLKKIRGGWYLIV
jgi:hypothetical protein